MFSKSMDKPLILYGGGWLCSVRDYPPERITSYNILREFMWKPTQFLLFQTSLKNAKIRLSTTKFQAF